MAVQADETIAVRVEETMAAQADETMAARVDEAMAGTACSGRKYLPYLYFLQPKGRTVLRIK